MQLHRAGACTRLALRLLLAPQAPTCRLSGPPRMLLAGGGPRVGEGELDLVRPLDPSLPPSACSTQRLAHAWMCAARCFAFRRPQRRAAMLVMMATESTTRSSPLSVGKTASTGRP